jgi:hypothetical protein
LAAIFALSGLAADGTQERQGRLGRSEGSAAARCLRLAAIALGARARAYLPPTHTPDPPPLTERRLHAQVVHPGRPQPRHRVLDQHNRRREDLGARPIEARERAGGAGRRRQGDGQSQRRARAPGKRSMREPSGLCKQVPPALQQHHHRPAWSPSSRRREGAHGGPHQRLQQARRDQERQGCTGTAGEGAHGQGSTTFQGLTA